MSVSQFTNEAYSADRRCRLMLTGSRVTSGFRSHLFDAANRAGLSVNEFVIRAAAEKLRVAGSEFPGVFEAGDFSDDTTSLNERVG